MMQLPNTAILNILIFSRRYHFRLCCYEILLRLVNTFTIDTDEYYLKRYKVNDKKPFKNLVGLYYTLCAAHKSSTYAYMCMYILQIGSFNWGL